MATGSGEWVVEGKNRGCFCVCVLVCTREAGACVFGCVRMGMYMSCVFERGEIQMPSCGGLHPCTSPATMARREPCAR